MIQFFYLCCSCSFCFFFQGFNMARLINAIFGSLRGKMGPVVFSANKSGDIVRRRVKGTNPKTAAQTTARLMFGLGSASWASLSGDEQAAYNDFAKNMFVPQKRKYMSKHTGAQAFRSVQTVVSNSTLKQLPTVIKKGSDDSAITHTVVSPSVTVSGPVSSVGANISDGSNPVKILRITDSSLSHAGALSFKVNFDPTAAGGLTGNTFTDGNGLKYGFTAYISTEVPNSVAAVKSKFFQNLGNTGILTLTAGGCAGENAVKVSWDCSSLTSKFKSWIAAGKKCYLTIVCIGSNGTMAPVGSEILTVS
jgi:hypothetical protein